MRRLRMDPLTRNIPIIHVGLDGDRGPPGGGPGGRADAYLVAPGGPSGCWWPPWARGAEPAGGAGVRETSERLSRASSSPRATPSWPWDAGVAGHLRQPGPEQPAPSGHPRRSRRANLVESSPSWRARAQKRPGADHGRGRTGAAAAAVTDAGRRLVQLRPFSPGGARPRHGGDHPAARAPNPGAAPAGVRGAAGGDHLPTTSGPRSRRSRSPPSSWGEDSPIPPLPAAASSASRPAASVPPGSSIR